MRACIIFIAAALLAWLGFYLAAPPAKRADQSTEAGRAPTSTVTDFAEVFQKAFWKRPTATDKILHAERREWSDVDGVRKWQWFIAVQPSAGLVKHLREDNAFNLVPAVSMASVSEAPSWFDCKSAGTEVLRAPHGQMRLIFSPGNQTLYATDSGGGFRAGAPEASKPLPAQVAASRLPRTPPPNPSPP